ncbi:MAG: hypothetical protein ABL919_00260 [Methylococcales bacterium]
MPKSAKGNTKTSPPSARIKVCEIKKGLAGRKVKAVDRAPHFDAFLGHVTSYFSKPICYWENRRPNIDRTMVVPSPHPIAYGVHGFWRTAIVVLALWFQPFVAWAQVTSLNQLSSYDAGEIIVSYYEYLALDCPNETACAFTKTISTPGQTQHKRVAAAITGFSLWTPKPDQIGKIAVRVAGIRGSAPGTVDLNVSGDFESSGKQLFSYRVQIAVIESSVEAVDLTEVSAACSVGRCPVSMIAHGAVPNGHRFLGFGLQMFDSDRMTSPLWGAVALPITTSIDPATGDVTAKLQCGSSLSPRLTHHNLSGPCETRWVAIAALPNKIVGGAVSGLALTPVAPQTVTASAGINSPNPITSTPSMVCVPHPNPPNGYLDVLAGFFLLSGQVRGNAFTPAAGDTSGMEVGVTTLGFDSTTGAPLLTYQMGLPVTQQLLPGLPPAISPLSYLRLTISGCL